MIQLSNFYGEKRVSQSCLTPFEVLSSGDPVTCLNSKMEFTLLLGGKEANIYDSDKQFETILGYDKKKIESQSVLDIFHPKDRYRFFTKYSNLIGSVSYQVNQLQGPEMPYSLLQQQKWKKSLLFHIKLMKMPKQTKDNPQENAEDDRNEEQMILLSATQWPGDSQNQYHQ